MAKNRIIEPGIKCTTTKAGEKRYEVRIRDGYGRFYPARWFSRLVDAKSYKIHLLGLKDRRQPAHKIRQRQISFNEYWKQWMEECRAGISDGWRKDQQRIGEIYLFPRLGPMPLADIRSRDIGAVIEFARVKGLGPASLRHIYNVMHKCFEDAIEHFEFLDSSPVIRRYCPKVPRTKRKFRHPNEAAQLLNTVRGHWLEPAIMIGLMAGLRPGEIQALTWENVDLEKAEIKIVAAYKRRFLRIEPYPKQKDHGSATIPKPLHDYLKQLSIGKDPKSYVAPGEQGGMLHYHLLHRLLPGLCEKAGVTIVTPHELRDSCTELWVYNGANQLDCGRQLNHANPSTTERYMHRTSDRLTAIGSNFTLPGYGEKKKPTLSIVR